MVDPLSGFTNQPPLSRSVEKGTNRKPGILKVPPSPPLSGTVHAGPSMAAWQARMFVARTGSARAGSMPKIRVEAELFPMPFPKSGDLDTQEKAVKQRFVDTPRKRRSRSFFTGLVSAVRRYVPKLS